MVASLTFTCYLIFDTKERLCAVSLGLFVAKLMLLIF